MTTTAEYEAELAAQAEQDDTAAPDQESQLGRQYYYVEDADS